MTPSLEIREAATDEDFAQVQSLATRYAEWDIEHTTRLGIPAADLLSFMHDYRAETLRTRYVGSPSRLLLGRVEGSPMACGAVDLSAPPWAEIKTFYVAPEARGRGIGTLLLQRLLAEAAEQRFDLVRLETVTFMTDAIRLYRSFGFIDCPPYHEIPISLKPITVYMSMDLKKGTG